MILPCRTNTTSGAGRQRENEMATHSLNQNLWRMPRHERLLRLVGEKLAEGARVHYWLALSATIVAAFGWAVLS